MIIIKILNILAKISKCICVTLVLIAFSTILVSYRISKESNINPFCNNKYENETINLNYIEIIDYSYKFSCSTLYINLIVDDSMNKQEILSLLLSISIELSYDCYIHYQVDSNTLEKTLYASYNSKYKQLSYVGG